jgi:hypothetical protein
MSSLSAGQQDGQAVHASLRHITKMVIWLDTDVSREALTGCWNHASSSIISFDTLPKQSFSIA